MIDTTKRYTVGSATDEQIAAWEEGHGNSNVSREGLVVLSLINRIKDLTLRMSEEKQDAARWRHFASSPQTALMLGSKLDPNDAEAFWKRECDLLADAAMAAPPAKEGA